MRSAEIGKRARLAIALAVASLVVACSSPSTGSLGPSLPSSTESPPPSPSIETQDALRFRTEFGLRADLDYITEVARDPTATFGFGVALLPVEVDDLLRRQATAEAAAPLLDAYGEEHPDEFAGWYQDQAHEGALVVLFTGHLEDHLRGLWQTLQGRTPPILVQVKGARSTLAMLAALQTRIEHDTSAWADRGIKIVFVATRVSLNVVELSVLAPAPTAEEQLADVYGPDDIIVYITDEPPKVT